MTSRALYTEANYWLKQMLGANAGFRPQQWEAVEALIVHNQRVLLVQRTGWGKSLVYFLATRLLRDQGAGTTVLISPLLALMRNQIQAAERIGLRAESINSDNRDEREAIEERLLAGEVDILLISPERLANDHFLEEVWPQLKRHVGLLVIDEAHCISDWGHDFRPNYRRIMFLLDELPPQTPVLGTTATANNRVVRDINEILGKELQILRGDLVRESLALFNYPEPMSAAYRLALLSIFMGKIAGSGIIYCSTTHDCVRVSRWLQSQGYNTKPYFSNVEEEIGERREKLEEQLLNNEVKALVASVALGMGFDKPDLSFVIHYQHPGSLVSYYQQIGRAGRGIENAYILLMHGPEDDEIQHYFIDTAFPTPAQMEAILHLFRTQPEWGRSDLLRELNVRFSTLEKMLLHLEVEGIIKKEGRTYRLIDNRRAPEYQRWEGVTRQRLAELDHMKLYIQHQGCLMRFIAEALDNPTPVGNCRRCKNCIHHQFKSEPDTALVDAASQFLDKFQRLVLEPKKQWPYGLKEKARFETTNQPGIALCHYHDQGFGELVRQGKYQRNYFSDALVNASAELLRQHFDTLDEPPCWVTAIPSTRRPALVPDFARRLALALSLEYRAALGRNGEQPEQKMMYNAYQQAKNLLEAFMILPPLVEAPVLLVDDMCDSGWTLTIAGDLLRQHHVPDVHPFALAKVGATVY